LVANDWARILGAFPYLKIKSQLYNAEESEDCDKFPVVQFDVGNKKVRVMKPKEELVGPEGLMHPEGKELDNFIAYRMFLGERAERGIEIDDLKRKLNDVYGEIPQLKEEQ
jgi:hypothetical protein